MLSSRKRKATPEKGHENLKMRKLKVSNKIFRSPGSPKPTNIAKTKISKLLPEGYDSMIVTANTKVEDDIEGNEALYGCVRLPIITKEDALIWLKKFEENTSTSYHSQKTWKSDSKTGLLKRKFLCSHSVSGVYSCKACIIFTIKDANEIQTNPDYYLRDYPSQVIIQFCHNHKIDADLYVKNLDPSTELRAIFGTYFAKGHSPFSALICHKCDLHSSYGPDFYDVVANAGICPSYNWCSREFEKLYTRKFVEPMDDELNEKLNEAVNQYNIKCFSECAVLAEDPFVLSVCTPLMKSVFRSGFAEDFITVRTFCTPKSVPKRQKLVLFLCHTPIGSLPFGIVLTFTEDSDVVCQGIKTLTSMLGEPSYSPKTIIVDENSLISKSLTKSFSGSQVVFNEFQMLQSIWRIVRLVCQDNNDEFQTVYNAFLVAINSASEEDFERNVQQLDALIDKYPKLTNFLKYFKFRSDSYIRYARPKVEFNTNVLSYTDSGTIILQDVSIKYGNFFNVLQLFDFLTRNYVNYYERKLIKIVDGDLKGFFKTNFFVPLSKIADFSCTKISDTEFLVGLNEMKFFVSAELDTCTCQVGVYGGSCVHQYIVEKTVGLVPECYTPLGEDMLDILKSILSYKDAKPQNQESENYIEDLVSSVGSSELGSMGDCSQDADNLGPIDEIYLAPAEVSESFTEQDVMSPLVLNDLSDSIENLNDSNQYRDIESATNSTNQLLASKIPHDGSTGKVMVYDYSDDHDEVKVIPVTNSMILTSYGISEGAVVSGMDTPVVYTYSTENEDPMRIYHDVMTENDKKTAEIAEFLTNLPDTNNLNSGDPVVSSTDYKPTMEVRDIQESEEPSEVLKQFQHQIVPTEDPDLTSESVVVIKNDELFTQYRVMENGVLSIITDTDDEYANQINTFQAASTQNFMGDSYEEANFIMMSPTDLFDNNENIDNSNENEPTTDKTESRINVLSSVVIKPPVTSLGISKTPLNVNMVKHKTLRSVKEDDRSRVNESDSSKDKSPTVVEQKGNTSLNIEEMLFQTEHKSSDEKNEKISVVENMTKVENRDIEESAEISECLNLTECDPEHLVEAFEDVIEIDSDDLEELASQDLDSALILGPDKPIEKKPPLKSIPIKNSKSKCVPLTQSQEVVAGGRILKTAFSQLTDLKNKKNIKGSAEKLLGKFKELDSGGLGSLGSVKKQTSKDISKSEIKRKNARGEVKKDSQPNDEYLNFDWRYRTSDSDSESSLLSDSDCFGSAEFEHYSDCRTSCSEFHSELEGLDDLSDYELYELTSSGNESSYEKEISKKSSNLLNPLSKLKKEKSYIIHLDSDSSDDMMSDDGHIRPSAIKSIYCAKIPAPKKANLQQMQKDSSNEKLSEIFKHIKAKKSMDPSKIRKETKFKLNNEVTVARIQPATNGFTFSKSFNKEKKAESPQQSKDAEELESILTHGLDTYDNRGNSKLKTKIPSILDNEELSFLFNDSRFETIIEDSESSEDNLVEIKKHPKKYLQYPLFKPKVPKKYKPILPKPSFSQGQLILPGIQVQSSVIKVKDEVQEVKPVRRRGRPRKSDRPILIQNGTTQKKPVGRPPSKEVNKNPKRPVGRPPSKEVKKTVGRPLSREVEAIKKVAQEFMEDDSDLRRNRRNSRNFSDKKRIRKSRIKSNQEQIFSNGLKMENNEIKTEYSPCPIKFEEREQSSEEEAPRNRGRRGRKSLSRTLPATSNQKATKKSRNLLLNADNSVLDSKTLQKKKVQKLIPSLVTSTPAKPRGYEDVFKRFLETSSEKLTKTFSDYEDYKDENNFGSRRRTKSASSPKLRVNPFAFKFLDNLKRKKSVSSAEYNTESDNESDDSEIKSPKKTDGHKKPARKRGRPRKATVEVESKKRAKSTPNLELIVLLERNIEIELMCQAQKKWSERNSKGRRRGYKELLENAKRMKDFKK